MSKKKDEDIGVAILAPFILVFWAFVCAWPIVWAWAYIMPSVFGLPTITYWQAFWAYAVLKSLWS